MRSDPIGAKAERSRQAIVDAAVRRFARDGFRATSIAAIARDAGVSRSLPYAYFDDAEALFAAALDQDAAALIDDLLAPLVSSGSIDLAWRDNAMRDVLGALERYPLARRVLAGLEPQVPQRMLELPALDRLRAGLADQLRLGQEFGLVRTDIDVDEIGRGAITLWLAMLLAAAQFGLDYVEPEFASIRAIVAAAVLVVPDAERT